MLDAKIQDALNKQINAEMYSSYLYLAMTSYFKNQNLDGFAHWLGIQAREEWSHAMKIYEYVYARGGQVTLKAIDEPPSKWSGPLNVFEEVYAHEQKVTAMVNELADLAEAQKDHATRSFLKWFIDEQVEEEDNVDGVVQRLNMIKDAPHALFMMDQYMARREG